MVKSNTGSGCLERLQSFHPWRCSEITRQGIKELALASHVLNWWGMGIGHMASRDPFHDIQETASHRARTGS